VDILSDVLALAAVRGSVAASVAAGPAWGICMADMPGAAIHAVAFGTAHLLIDGRDPLLLAPGDVVLLPGGPTHVLASSPAVPVRPFDHDRAAAAVAAGEDMQVGEQPVCTRILCASYRHDPATTVAAFSLLPDIVHVPAASASHALRSSVQLLSDELSQPAPGTSTVLDHIANVLLIQMLRAWLAASAREERPPSWLRGLADPVIRTAMAELHAQPSRPWTVDVLAQAAGVSQATLMRRFVSEVGCPPSDYLRSWRMELAAHRLRTTDEPVGVIARGVGYTSEYAFNRAFARLHGMPPGRYRSTSRG
jgi:AraC-like DNA-binding protein